MQCSAESFEQYLVSGFVLAMAVVHASANAEASNLSKDLGLRRELSAARCLVFGLEWVVKLHL
jgi:hypothetical protein